MFDYKEYRNTLNSYDLKHAPAELFLEGDALLLTEGRRVCVVGSRNASPEGIKRAETISKWLCESNIIVVSGLAKGIDTAAHKTALVHGRTIAVLGTPLDVPYPKENSDLLEDIKRDHLAISQFNMGYPTRKENFPIRNKTMALISDATIIVEAQETSGTQHQGWEALRIGRKLYIMENVMGVSWAKKMIDYGAVVLTRSNFGELIEDIPFRSFSNLLEWAF